jgi:hypothetical protein
MRATAYATADRLATRACLFFAGGSAPEFEHPFPVNRLDPRTRFAALILLVALVAASAVAVFRLRAELSARRVELAMDYQDFVALARSFNYNPQAFLIELRRAGLTSLALTEELGANVGDDGKAYATTGASLLNQARLTPLRDPLLQSLAQSGKLARNAVYLIVYDRSTLERYQRQLPLHFESHSIRVLRASLPAVIELHSQIDFFNNTGMGIPSDQLAIAKKLHLLVIPRFQNEERFTADQMNAMVDNVLAQDRLVSTIVFFGLRNEVFGYPDHLDDAASVFKAHGKGAPPTARQFSFGYIETYDVLQDQKGAEGLAKLIPGQTVRVQAIAKTELDKIKLDEVVGRYVLGVRERNVRVVYLRPWGHQDGNLSIEKTNVEMVKQIADELKSHGFRLGPATPIPTFRGDNPILVGVASLAVPSAFVLLLPLFGWYRRSFVIAAYTLTVMLFAGGVFSHHEMLARSILALAGALLFATGAFLALAPAFAEEPAQKFFDQCIRSVGWTLVATAVALLGALVVVGLLSSPLTMEEVERFRGVKAVLAVPPLIALCLYLFSPYFSIGERDARSIFTSPIRVYQLLVGLVIVGAGALLVIRSGNQSDIAPSSFELVLRHYLTDVLSVRPRFKEFLLGVPMIMVLPALLPAHRRAAGWLFALGIGVGIADVIDTFSHLHTALLISLQRVGNGLVIGILIGALLIWAYRRACSSLGLLRVR